MSPKHTGEEVSIIHSGMYSSSVPCNISIYIFLGSDGKKLSNLNSILIPDQLKHPKSHLFEHLHREHHKVIKTTFQGKVYNFLERPTGWKCFLYHFTV